MNISIITPWSGDTVHLLSDYSGAVDSQRAVEVITIDNACGQLTAESLREFHMSKGVYLRNKENVGFATANNQGYMRATGDVIVFLNSDVRAVASPHWLAQCATVKDNHLYGPSLQQHFAYAMPVPYLEGWCIAATRRTWDRLLISEGPWDAASYPTPYFEDNDLCLRALQTNIGLIPTPHWNLQHKGGQTTGPSLKYGESYEKNRTMFVTRVRSVWETRR